MLNVLSDGERHTREELMACLYDDHCKPSNLSPHIMALKKIVEPLGQTVVCELYKNSLYYRQVVLLSQCGCRKKAVKNGRPTVNVRGSFYPPYKSKSN
jgi:hypothetical protein